jgi:hypothetical protein
MRDKFTQFCILNYFFFSTKANVMKSVTWHYLIDDMKSISYINLQVESLQKCTTINFDLKSISPKSWAAKSGRSLGLNQEVISLNICYITFELLLPRPLENEFCANLSRALRARGEKKRSQNFLRIQNLEVNFMSTLNLDIAASDRASCHLIHTQKGFCWYFWAGHRQHTQFDRNLFAQFIAFTRFLYENLQWMSCENLKRHFVLIKKCILYVWER